MFSSIEKIDFNFTVGLSLKDLLPEAKTLQRSLLVFTTASAVFSLIPSCRKMASLAMRAASLATAGVSCASARNCSELALRCAKAAAIALGLAGVVLTRPALVVTSLVADLATRCFECVQDIPLEFSPGRTLQQMGISLVDTFAMGALLIASPPLMLFASIFSSFSLLAAAENAFTKQDSLEMSCYTILMLTNAVNAYHCYEAKKTVGKESQFLIKNRYEHDLVLLDKNQNEILRLKPDEIADFEISSDLAKEKFKLVEGLSHTRQSTSSAALVHDGYQIYGKLVDAQGQVIRKLSFSAEHTKYQTYITKPAIEAKELPFIGIAGTVIATPEIVQ